MELRNGIIIKTKYLLLVLSIVLFFWASHIAIKNYEIRFYLKQTSDSMNNDTIKPNHEKVEQIHAFFNGSQYLEPKQSYSIKEIGEAFKYGFYYFSGIGYENGQIHYGVVICDKKTNIRRYFSLISTDSTYSNFMITTD
ncbi:MAG: hypothetical protein WCP69_01810 [Bacteroidota bacterium]